MKKRCLGAFRFIRVVGLTAGVMTTASCFYVYEPPQPPPAQTGLGPGMKPPELESDPEVESETAPEQEPEREVATPRPRPKPPTAGSYPVAKKVPGREGFVFSPFNNKLIDVKGFPSGSEVRDPSYPASEGKIFLVP